MAGVIDRAWCLKNGAVEILNGLAFRWHLPGGVLVLWSEADGIEVERDSGGWVPLGWTPLGDQSWDCDRLLALLRVLGLDDGLSRPVDAEWLVSVGAVKLAENAPCDDGSPVYSFELPGNVDVNEFTERLWLLVMDDCSCGFWEFCQQHGWSGCSGTWRFETRRELLGVLQQVAAYYKLKAEAAEASASRFRVAAVNSSRAILLE